MNTLRTKWNRRPFPGTWLELKHMRTSWSQFGEDLLIAQLVGYEKTDGFYVDVGCFHPVIYSNTFAFYRRNWRGLCIDPNPVTAQLWRQNRPRDQIVTTAIAGEPGEAYYVEDEHDPACNRIVFDPQTAGAGNGNGKPAQFKPITVSPLSAILDSHVPAGTKIDLLSIDCEGLDLEVLKSARLEDHMPGVLVIEDHDLSAKSAISEYAQACGMRLVAQTFISKIFVPENTELPFLHEELAG